MSRLLGFAFVFSVGMSQAIAQESIRLQLEVARNGSTVATAEGSMNSGSAGRIEIDEVRRFAFTPTVRGSDVAITFEISSGGKQMGYGARRADLAHVGGAGDGGIDGVISLDRLGLEKVYVQAKRWQNSVGRPEAQGFKGAMEGNHARRGVLITTSSFS